MRIYSLFNDSQNRIWIGYNGGVKIIDNKTFDPVNLAILPSLRIPAVKTILQLKDGQVLLGTNSGIYSWNERNLSMTKLNSEENEPDNSPQDVNCLYADKSGNIWSGTDGQEFSLLITITVFLKRFQV